MLPGAVLLFFVLLTLAPLRAPYLSGALPLLPALVVFQFSLVTPERLPGPLLLAMVCGWVVRGWSALGCAWHRDSIFGRG